MNKFQSQYEISIHKNVFEISVCKMSAILSSRRGVNP